MVRVNIGGKEFAPGMTFVALSRVREFANLAFDYVNLPRLTNIAKSNEMVLRQREEDRLAALMEVTLRRRENELIVNLPAAALLRSMAELEQDKDKKKPTKPRRGKSQLAEEGDDSAGPGDAAGKSSVKRPRKNARNNTSKPAKTDGTDSTGTTAPRNSKKRDLTPDVQEITKRRSTADQSVGGSINGPSRQLHQSPPSETLHLEHTATTQLRSLLEEGRPWVPGSRRSSGRSDLARLDEVHQDGLRKVTFLLPDPREETRLSDIAAVNSLGDGLKFDSALFMCVIRRVYRQYGVGPDMFLPDAQRVPNHISQPTFIFLHIAEGEHWAMVYRPAVLAVEARPAPFYYLDSANWKITEAALIKHIVGCVHFGQPGLHHVTVERVPVPPQPDSYSCGLRVVAMTTLLLTGRISVADLGRVVFSSSELCDWFKAWISDDPQSSIPPFYVQPHPEGRIIKQKISAIIAPLERDERIHGEECLCEACLTMMCANH
jgi:hypothetical protein